MDLDSFSPPFLNCIRDFHILFRRTPPWASRPSPFNARKRTDWTPSGVVAWANAELTALTISLASTGLVEVDRREQGYDSEIALFWLTRSLSFIALIDLRMRLSHAIAIVAGIGRSFWFLFSSSPVSHSPLTAAASFFRFIFQKKPLADPSPRQSPLKATLWEDNQLWGGGPSGNRAVGGGSKAADGCIKSGGGGEGRIPPYRDETITLLNDLPSPVAVRGTAYEAFNFGQYTDTSVEILLEGSVPSPKGVKSPSQSTVSETAQAKPTKPIDIPFRREYSISDDPDLPPALWLNATAETTMIRRTACLAANPPIVPIFKLNFLYVEEEEPMRVVRENLKEQMVGIINTKIATVVAFPSENPLASSLVFDASRESSLYVAILAANDIPAIVHLKNVIWEESGTRRWILPFSWPSRQIVDFAANRRDTDREIAHLFQNLGADREEEVNPDTLDFVLVSSTSFDTISLLPHLTSLKKNPNVRFLAYDWPKRWKEMASFKEIFFKGGLILLSLEFLLSMDAVEALAPIRRFCNESVAKPIPDRQRWTIVWETSAFKEIQQISRGESGNSAFAIRNAAAVLLELNYIEEQDNGAHLGDDEELLASPRALRYREFVLLAGTAEQAMEMRGKKGRRGGVHEEVVAKDENVKSSRKGEICLLRSLFARIFLFAPASPHYGAFPKWTESGRKVVLMSNAARILRVATMMSNPLDPGERGSEVILHQGLGMLNATPASRKHERRLAPLVGA
ncbi:hypothetical protein BDK51DRAFT_29824 [Blyttiomyces helicus]|uniref:Uncharacterized protein n=1 Tax=Blyttiomyces helicus TaxID=388810 RepID=A0A4P9WHC8_9FUNG|nr:hypothetical protein BDK51DRAFT_29824 [Blyttiomyces helicus]|eukprot:RKO91253.1 hypothetical protein BDK51DRAFT_29824 [Blyttiomyces helicus]